MADGITFEDFYRSTRHRVVTVLYALGGDLAEAQDAAQEAYARGWQRWRRVEPYADPEAWVRKVGYRLMLNRWRKVRNGLVAYRRHGPVGATDPPSEDTVAGPPPYCRTPICPPASGPTATTWTGTGASTR